MVLRIPFRRCVNFDDFNLAKIGCKTLIPLRHSVIAYSKRAPFELML